MTLSIIINDIIIIIIFTNVIYSQNCQNILSTHHGNGNATQTQRPALRFCCQQNGKRKMGQNQDRLPWVVSNISRYLVKIGIVIVFCYQ